MKKNTRKKLPPFTLVDEDDEDEVVVKERSKTQKATLDDDEDDEDGFDEFEVDGFIVDDEEEEEEGDQDKQTKKKKRKRKSLKNLVLDDDDLELLRENQISGLFQPKSSRNKKFRRLKKVEDSMPEKCSGFSEDDASLYDGDAEEEQAIYDDEDDMADFIVYDEERYEKGAPVRQWELEEKESRKVTVASSSKLEEAGYTIGDADELLKRQGLVKIVKTDDFDNSELDKYMAERDERVKNTDVPERMQMFEEVAGAAPVDEMSIEEEASWILNQLTTDTPPLLCRNKAQEDCEGVDLLKKINKEDIVRFLKLHNLEKYDIPFIAMYRKEECLSLLEDLEEDGIQNKYSNGKPKLKWHKILWAISELDKKWLLLQKRKSKLKRSYKKRYEEECNNIDDLARLSLIEQHFETIMKLLMLAETERDVDDVGKKFSLHFPPTGDSMVGKFRSRERRSEYNECSNAGLWELAVKFVCGSRQFGLNLMQEKMGVEFWKDLHEPPEVIASKFTCPSLETPEKVLKGARHMAALEISCEPSVRKHVRGIFIDKALVSTRPTPNGEKEIDSRHQFSAIKWLCEKPLSKFQDAQWLLIQKAEEEKLLDVTIKLPEGSVDKLISEYNETYLSGGGDGYTQLWDEQRKLILQDAFSNFLIPSLEKDIRALLASRAKRWLRVVYGEHFWNKVSIAPYQCKENVADLEKGVGPRVMACCWGPGNPTTTFVMLDSYGQLLDVLQAGSVSLRSQNVIDQQRKKHDQQRVHRFIASHKPHVIILGAVNVSCARLKDDIKEIISNMNESDQVLNGISVFYGDETLPLLYENSEVSLHHLPGQEGIVKRAVALGRYLQNPLAMIATLCGVQKEIVYWKLTSLDHFLTSDEKYGMIEMVMVDITNQVGLDINFALSHDWLFGPLQFVSGLGPQMAAFLHGELIVGKKVVSRRELAGCGLRTEKIFCNAVGFLHVCSRELLSFGSESASLDNTRIHPESYGLAEKLIEDVYNNFDQAQPMEHVKNNRQLLIDFDINDYANNYELEKEENKKETLNDIKMELLSGFLDPRKPYEEPTQDEEFYMISGRNEDAYEGRIVQAIVRRVLSHRAFCALDCGLNGMVTKDDYSEETGDYSLTEKLHEGDILTCKIIQIDKSRHQVLLTCKESELKNSREQNLHEVEPYYFEGHSSLVNQQVKNHKEELEKKYFKSRIIVHPHFKNMTGNEAIEFLSDKDVGGHIFRPSLRGLHYLTLTLKVCNGLYVHKDIIECGKDLKDISSMLHLGKTLKIGDDMFKDLDEVIDQYVDPLITHLKSMLSFRKFKGGSKQEVDEFLKAEKSDNPMRIAYCFGISHEHPGTYILSYIRTNLHHEYIGLHPKGFKFRKQIFGKVEQLVAYFQQHIDDLKYQPALMRSPAFGSSAGAPMDIGNEGGWKDQLNSSKGRRDYGRDDGGIDGDPSGFPGATRCRGRGRGRGDGRGRGRGRGRGNGHPSGLPRPNGGRGRGQGRGHCSYDSGQLKDSNEKEESGHGTASNWGSDGGGRWCSSGSTDDNSGKETFNAKWDCGGSSAASGKSWGDSFGCNTGGWIGKEGDRTDGSGSWARSEGGGGSFREGWGSRDTNQGGRDGRGRGRGRGHGHGCDSYNSGSQNAFEETSSGGWGGGATNFSYNSSESQNAWKETCSGGLGGRTQTAGGGNCSGGSGNTGDCAGSDDGGSWGWIEGSVRGGGSIREGGSSGTYQGGHDGRGRGRGRGPGHGCGPSRDSYNSTSQNAFKETPSGGWNGGGTDVSYKSRTESAGGGNWGSGGSGNTGGWAGSDNGESAGGGSWGSNRGRGRGRASDWSGREGGRGMGHQDGSNGRGRGRWRGRGHRGGFSNGRGDDNHNRSDFGNSTSYWSTPTKDSGNDNGGGNSGAHSSYSWGNDNGGNASGSSWGGSRQAGNAGGSNWVGSGNDSQGILGSGPASGSSWAASNNTGGNGGWGTGSSQGGSHGDFNTNSESGITGWGSGSGNNSSGPAGGNGWSGNGNGGW